jgi:hypothetical protein
MPFQPKGQQPPAYVSANDAASAAQVYALQASAASSTSQAALLQLQAGNFNFSTKLFSQLTAPAGGKSASVVITDSPIATPGAMVTVGGGSYTVSLYYDISAPAWRIAG